jgi:hypothetical protein
MQIAPGLFLCVHADRNLMGYVDCDSQKDKFRPLDRKSA